MSTISRKLDYIRDPKDDFPTYLEKAKAYQFRCIFARSEEEFRYANNHFDGFPLIIAGAIDFPEGTLSQTEKLAMFQTYASIGYKEIDYVLNQHNVECGNLSAIEEEMRQVHAFCQSTGIREKVIVEFCKLDGKDDIKRAICEIANRVQPAFLKTSTGKSFKGADINDVRLMKQCLCEKVKIKASGGIRTYEQAKQFFDAGVSVIGATAAIEIATGHHTTMNGEISWKIQE